jgi:hypothetical protein
MSLHRTLTTLLALIASASALPTSTSHTAKLDNRESLECPTGSWYSKCGVIDGCFSYDPCTGQRTPPPPPPPPPASCTSGRVIAPQLLNLSPLSPDAPASASTSNLMAVLRDHSEEPRFQDQVALFRGIPKDAKTCQIGWRQNGSPAQVFKTFGDGGRLSTKLIPSLPSPVTYSAVRALVPAEAPETSLDFTNWDTYTTPEEHNGGNVPCSESIYVYLTLTDDIKKGGVIMQGVSGNEGTPAQQQGLWIDYTC